MQLDCSRSLSAIRSTDSIKLILVDDSLYRRYIYAAVRAQSAPAASLHWPAQRCTPIVYNIMRCPLKRCYLFLGIKMLPALQLQSAVCVRCVRRIHGRRILLISLSRYVVRLYMDSRMVCVWIAKNKNGNIFLAQLLKHSKPNSSFILFSVAVQIKHSCYKV